MEYRQDTLPQTWFFFKIMGKAVRALFKTVNKKPGLTWFSWGI
jgi:hypothetical protein